MDKTKREELEKAYRKETDSRVVPRMLAVHMVRVRKMSIGETAANLMRSERWVHEWLKRFDTGGLDGLRDLPRTGRPSKIPHEIMARIIERSIQPKCTPRVAEDDTRGDRHQTAHNKRPEDNAPVWTGTKGSRVHISRASRDVVRSCQYRFGRRVPCMEEERFTILDMDEVFFVYDVISGRKYWSPRGERIVVPYTGSHRRIVVYGAIAKDARHLFRTRGSFDAPTFVWYLKELQGHVGKAVMDRVSPYRAKVVKKLLQENKTSKPSTFRKDLHTSTRSRNASARESRFCSYQNTIERLLTCAMPSPRIIGL